MMECPSQFVVGLLTFFGVAFLFGVAWLIVWARRTWSEEEGHQLINIVLKDGKAWIENIVRIVTEPRRVQGDPEGIHTAHKSAGWLGFSQYGDTVKLKEGEFKVIPHVSNPDEDYYGSSTVFNGLHFLDESVRNENTKLREANDALFNKTKRLEINLDKKDSDLRLEFEQWKKDHKDVNRSGPIIGGKGSGK